MGSGWPEVSISCGFQFLSLTRTPCFRTKKWNVSCESYGNRWKVEDVVGVLVDMDLLEMKFFINGADMGPAFTNFQSSGLFPAISLNVRQCLRVNYGQELFIYPPDIVDGMPFRPVCDALHWKVSLQKNSESAESLQSSVPATNPPERVTIIQSESVNPGNISSRIGSAGMMLTFTCTSRFIVLHNVYLWVLSVSSRETLQSEQRVGRRSSIQQRCQHH